VSDLWGSARQSLAYMFSCRRGPALKQPRYSTTSPSTGHHHLDHVLVGSLLYGDIAEGCIGVVPGDDLDEELRDWVTDRDAEPSDRVREVVSMLRQLLEQHGLTSRPTCPQPSEFYRFTNPDGTRSGLRMRDHRANSTGADSGS
jgi:hypothetical protein